MVDKKSIVDDEARTTPVGLFHTAESFWRAALALQKTKVRSTHPTHPVYFLYYHAIELYLKAYLRLHGHKVKELSDTRKFGHKIGALAARAAELGLEYMDEDVEIFERMANTDAVIRSRYIKTGAFNWPTLEGLDRTCCSIREPIGTALRASGLSVQF